MSCGGGARQRTRDCSNPVPQYGGTTCEGTDTQSDFCNTDPCPSEFETVSHLNPFLGFHCCLGS